MYVDYMGDGPAEQIDRFVARGPVRVQDAPGKPAAATEEAAPPEWVKAVEDAVGRKGTFKGGVLSYGVPRSNTITMAGMTPLRPELPILSPKNVTG
jgi:hypothetical protein